MENKIVLNFKAPKLSFLTLMISLAIAGSSNVVTAQQNDAIRDRLAITDVLTQYSYRWDGKDSAGFAALFTEDGIMERWLFGELVEGSRVEGKAAIFDYARRSHEGRLADRQTRHHFSGIVFLELNEDTAVTENMALITHQTAEDPAAYISSSGIYRNTWRKTADGWRIARRILMSDRFRN